jgi:hypothetical protein
MDFELSRLLSLGKSMKLYINLTIAFTASPLFSMDLKFVNLTSSKLHLFVAHDNMQHKHIHIDPDNEASYSTIYQPSEIHIVRDRSVSGALLCPTSAQETQEKSLARAFHKARSLGKTKVTFTFTAQGMVEEIAPMADSTALEHPLSARYTALQRFFKYIGY